MASHSEARRGVLETMEDYFKRRQSEMSRVGEQAAAMAREAYGQAIRAGENLNLTTTSDVRKYGADLLAGKKPIGITTRRGTNTGAGKPVSTADRHPANFSHGSGWLDRSAGAKFLGGGAVRSVGRLPGAARGAWHTARDFIGAADFAARLIDPYDAETSPQGEAAWDKVFRSADALLEETECAIANPRTLGHSVEHSISRLNSRLNPDATPVENTFVGEMRRNFNIGLNQGEALFDIGSTLYGGAEAKSLMRLRQAVGEKGASKYMARGVPPGTSRYFATPYDGRGHHSIPVRTTLPKWMGGGPVPSIVSNSPFFLLRPPGISKGDMFELHYKVDPQYYGGKISKEFGGGPWSGDALGWKKHGLLARAWYGSPAPLKAVAGGMVVGAGGFVDHFDDELSP